MNPILKNALAIVAGIALGSVANMGLILLGNQVVPLPEGIDPNDPESLKANAHLLEARHFVFPFLAHALGTLVGAFAAAKLGPGRPMMLAGIVGGFFLLGGISNLAMIPHPLWFAVLDLGLAYLPTAWLGGYLAKRGQAA